MNKLALLIEENSLACFYKKHLGMDCPGCGFQRALIHLLRGEFAESIQIYPALIPTLIMLLFLGLHVVLKLKFGAKILLWLFIINASLMMGNFFIKIAN